jgi:hypothetical protein
VGLWIERFAEESIALGAIPASISSRLPWCRWPQLIHLSMMLSYSSVTQSTSGVVAEEAVAFFVGPMGWKALSASMGGVDRRFDLQRCHRGGISDGCRDIPIPAGPADCDHCRCACRHATAVSDDFGLSAAGCVTQMIRDLSTMSVPPRRVHDPYVGFTGKKLSGLGVDSSSWQASGSNTSGNSSRSFLVFALEGVS